MGSFLGRFLLPLLLLTAAALDWNLISFFDLLAFFAIQFTGSKAGFLVSQRALISWCMLIFSVFVIVVRIAFYVVWMLKEGQHSFLDRWWVKFIGFMSVLPWRSESVFYYFLAIQLAIALVALLDIYEPRYCLIRWRDSRGRMFFPPIERLGSHLRVTCCLLLPVIQLVVGICHPSWVSLPFFVCSCIGLIDWSLTGNFLGLFWWWRPLLIYAGIAVVLLYIYQFPVTYPVMVQLVADFIGFYKISATSEWTEILSAVSLLVFYVMLSSVKCDLQEMDTVMSMRSGTLTEQLLPSKHSFFIRISRSGVSHTNVLLRRAVFQSFSINFFTYGFPVSLLVLSFWSFNFVSICAFGLLAYVGYILYAFPSLFHLHRLNGLLLVFILLWAVSTYVFNVAFTFFNKRIQKDMEIWETVGLWHYPIPGFFLLAQFCLGFLVAMCNLVNNSVFLYLSDEDRPSVNDDFTAEGEENTQILIVATVAWGLRKCSRAITLALIFLLTMKSGLIHAVYMSFFLLYLLSYCGSKKLRQALILFCEAHFAVLYILQLNIVSKALEQKGSLTTEILSQLGLLGHASLGDFIKLAALLLFCAIQNHGSKLLFSLSSIVQNTAHSPFGFSIMKAGLNKSVLLSVLASPVAIDSSFGFSNSSNDKWITKYLSMIGQKFLTTYRSCGTYIAFATILLTVYLVTPNYVSFGYLFFLLLWVIGRQLLQKTRRRIWLPLKIYAVFVLVFIYTLCTFSAFEIWLSKKIDLYHDLGYKPKTSLLKNIWEPLAVLIVMQLYSYERRQSRYINKYGFSERTDRTVTGLLGFFTRFLVWHSDKFLSLAVFYASISPISALGFLYLVGLVICSILPKASHFPSKLFLMYTGFLVMLEYLFQMWGAWFEMFPGQKHSDLALLLGFQLFGSGFKGIESGLRGKVLVIVACILRYNVFQWLEKMQGSQVSRGKWEEPCYLFISAENFYAALSICTDEQKPLLDSDYLSAGLAINSSRSFDSPKYERANSGSLRNGEVDQIRYSFGHIWGNSKESHKWNKKRIAVLKKERFDMQKTTLRIYIKFWIENFFNLLGLEINMIVLLLASFISLNAISMLYILCLAACILLNRHWLRRLWPIFFFIFASILTLEYLAIWDNQIRWNQHAHSEMKMKCHDCWSNSNRFFDYCKKCWLGIIFDDRRMLLSYYMVFMFSSFKLRADHTPSFRDSQTYHLMMSQFRDASVWSGLSFETKSLWTILDYLRIFLYCHLLDIVLALILITGTLEYDILHLGYLGFALVFFRMRLEILKKKKKFFKFLRMYNFAVIVLSLAYQSPFFGESSAEKCEKIDYVYEIIGFYKYDYGFRITSRSALVEIIIFILVSIQSYIFNSKQFDHVSKYLEAEQIGAIVHEQEKKAAWKTVQLHHIRKSEEQKRQRNLQVEKMKSEMLNLQNQLHRMNSGTFVNTSPKKEGIRQRQISLINSNVEDVNSKDNQNNRPDLPDLFLSDFVITNSGRNVNTSPVASEMNDSPLSRKMDSSSASEATMQSVDSSLCEITEVNEMNVSSYINSDERDNKKQLTKENPLVQLIGDGVSQVQSLGNQAVTNIVSFLNIENEESNLNEHSSEEDGLYYEIEGQNKIGFKHLDRVTSVQSNHEKISSDAARLQLGMILRYIWGQMRSNNDVVCYCCFVLVFLWNFSLLSMVYLAALFLYALCVYSGPTFMFWVIMLIYTEVNILLQYLYQVIIQHCGLNFNIHKSLLLKLGFPADKINSSFVISMLPLFLVYVFTLLQSSITLKEGEWESLAEFKVHKKVICQEEVFACSSYWMRIRLLLLRVNNFLKAMVRALIRYWKSLTLGAESPPHFVQLSLEVNAWPNDAIQPERIESGVNKLLVAAHEKRCKDYTPSSFHCPSRVRVQSIERSQENSNIALAIFEVVYASPLGECPAMEWYKSLTPAADVAAEIHQSQRIGLIEEMGFPYPIVSVIGGGRREVDLYAYVFGADLAVFFLVAIFYQSIIKNNSKLLEVYQIEDQFPKEFVFILMVIFFLIVLDRIIYLCSFATGKLIFYLFNLVLFTYSVTIYAWYLEPSKQNAGGFALRAIYLMKAVSSALQALQIRYGIPHKSTLYRQFLTSKVSQINYLGFRLYRALPFLYELRCVLDWSCTTTSLTMYDWLKLEDIHASLYLVKCDADLNRATHKQGEKQTKMTKFCSGICLFFVLICVIWAPMLMYSSGNPTNIANPVKDASVQIDIKAEGGRLTLYQTTLCEIFPFENQNSNVDLDPNGYLDTYNVKDIQLICCQADASTVWLVPQMVQTRFIRTLDLSMQIIFSWVFNRDRPKGKETVKYEIFVPEEDQPMPLQVEEVFNGTSNSFRISNIYPRYFKVTGSGEARTLEQTRIEMVSGDLYLNHANPPWWSFHDSNASDLEGCEGLSGPTAIVVSEETPQGILGETLSKFSIWGIYITFVLAVGRFIRIQCSDLRMRIPYENLPSCDRLMAICEDIYVARAEGELEVEEVLYWTLIKIYRSPHMLLEFTQPD